jgi:diguanylate cyclase (GGDEF)-like protein/PAS domain S-box-containing protein
VQRSTLDRERRVALDDFWQALVDTGRDLPALLRLIAERVVDVIGDGCILTRITDDGVELQPEVITHVDVDVAAAMRAVLGQGNIRIGEGVAGCVARDRRPVLLNDLEPESLVEATPARFAPFLRDHPMRALMIVPLTAGEELLGTLGAVRTRARHGYTPADRRMLEALAERAALAIAAALAAPTTIGAADFEAIYRHNLDGVLLTAPDGHILAANPAACSILRMTESQIVRGGRDPLVFADDPNLRPALAERAASGRVRAELQMRRGDGTSFVADVSSTIFTTPDGKVRASVIFRDISNAVAARDETMHRLAELEDIADHDPLTGLLNRRGFAIACQQALAAADRRGLVSQLVFIDVDGLKARNDSEGHAAGDAALVAVASAILRAVRGADVACRIGGDEFVVFAADTSSDDVAGIADRIRGELGLDPAAPPGLSFSIGVVERSPRDERSLDALIDVADRDMYQQRTLRRLRAETAPPLA